MGARAGVACRQNERCFFGGCVESPDAGVCDGGCTGPPDAGVCKNLCLKQAACDGGINTRVRGVVLTPRDPDAGYGTPDPLPGAHVYVPNAEVYPFDGGVTCDRCSDPLPGEPLVRTTSGVDGTFSLDNVPCGIDVPLVIQLGRWRRQISIPSVACCQETVLSAQQTRLPRRQAELHPNDNIPQIAVVTGDADRIECLLPKLGIADEEYTLPSGGGRVHFFRDNGSYLDAGIVAASTLYTSPTELAKYDMVIVGCAGMESGKTSALRSNLEAYANQGGRLFLTHFGYVWLFAQPNPISFSSTALWNPSSQVPPDQEVRVDTSFGGGALLGQWLYAVGAQATSSTPQAPSVALDDLRFDLLGINAPAERRLFRIHTLADGGLLEAPLQYTFGTPVSDPPPQQCGKVHFMDFHVYPGAASTFPGACTPGPLAPDEKVLEYLLFDLGACVGP